MKKPEVTEEAKVEAIVTPEKPKAEYVLTFKTADGISHSRNYGKSRKEAIGSKNVLILAGIEAKIFLTKEIV